MALGRFLKVWAEDEFLLYGPSTNHRLWSYSLQPSVHMYRPEPVNPEPFFVGHISIGTYYVVAR